MKVIFAMIDGAGAGADSSSSDISIRVMDVEDHSLPGRSNRQGGELVRRSFPLDLRVRYALHVRGNDLSSAHRMNRGGQLAV